MQPPSRTRRRLAAGLFTILAALGGAASVGTARADTPTAREPIDDPIPGHIANGAIQLKLQTVAEGAGLTAPNWGTFAPGVPGFLYVVDQDGPLWAVHTRTGAKRKVLDTASLLVPLILAADERGFLGVAFHPSYATTGLLYTMTSERIPGTASTPNQQPNHLATVREWRVPNPTANPLTRMPLTPAASRVVLRITEPQFNHNGGALFFGTRASDRNLLYITSGDGGCADDQHGQLGLAGEGPCISHEGPGNAQRRDNLLGKILRLDPRAGGAPQIFALGFRNPFRASSDRADLGGTGQIWAADVGQNHVEEVDARIVQNGNYGWRVKEGTFQFEPNGFDLLGFASDGFPFANTPGQPAGLIDPVAQYDHDEGVATIGGFVYRGSRFPELRGTYVFGDYSDGFTSANGRVMYVREGDQANPKVRTPGVFNLVNGHINLFVLGFGEDRDGELYVLANKTGGPDGDTGAVLKLVRECTGAADCRD
ncbi:MAG TPA: PQQ-dependent sugar dehydrogenase [Intrasporangium sp.]|uniref:PQQ-dependent sugar dehydrogenase n=1 Tax=Intrasporangium sp. TaxID=1925024 RepID=UPI002D796D96|nr:PQQ-dependent sugar dehydrogenase [Intrasporangium sp.]HET7398196.1 PQQ-dependent sugar dehydrogenase [Intrasporangium sp.]